MTTGALGGELGDEARAPTRQPALMTTEAPLAISEILDLTDRILTEPGRRSHLFAWLRRPGGGPADWLAVDAYYPGSRLVVVCEETAGPHREIYAELVPAHGLRLLEVDTSELTGGREAARHSLERRIAALAPAPMPGTAAPESVPRRSRAPRLSRGSHQSAPAPAAQPRPPRPAGQRQTAGVVAGLALATLLVAEVYLGVARAGFDSGHVLVAFGLALDVCSRGLGTIAASREGSPEWAWCCALGGSPVVAWFALFQRGGPVRTEPAPLAGLIGLLALVVLAVALLAAAL